MNYMKQVAEMLGVEKQPKFPKDGTQYCFIMPDGRVNWTIFEKKSTYDTLNFKTGNFFLTKEEITEEDIKRIVEMLNSPERLV